MKRNIKTTMGALLATAMVVTPMPVMAADYNVISTGDFVDSAASAETDVSLTMQSDFSVIIPKRVYAESNEFSMGVSMDITVKGNLAPEDMVYVATESTLELHHATSAEKAQVAVTTGTDKDTMKEYVFSKDGGVNLADGQKQAVGLNVTFPHAGVFNGIMEFGITTNMNNL